MGIRWPREMFAELRRVREVAKAEIERLTASHAELEAIGKRMIAESDRLRAALKPFADAFSQFEKEHAEAFSTQTPDDAEIMLLDNDHDAHTMHLTVGDFRRALAALEQSTRDAK